MRNLLDLLCKTSVSAVLVPFKEPQRKHKIVSDKNCPEIVHNLITKEPENVSSDVVLINGSLNKIM